MMYCPNCGAPHPHERKRCGACGTHLDVQVVVHSGDRDVGAQVTSIAVPPVSSHVLFATITTLFCCLPLGLIALVHASQVQPCVARGDYIGAEIASHRARTWAILSFVVGVISVALPALRATFLVVGL